MFSTLKMRIILGVYVFVVISIPIGAYLASEQTTFKSKASETKSASKATTTSPKPTISPAKDLQKQSEEAVTGASPTPTPTQQPSVATSFGPTLSLKVSLEGRPKTNQSDRLFVGIVEGKISLNPKFLLSFTIDLPQSGEYSGLSLAGLTPKTTYSALVKGSAQIAKAVEFIMAPTQTSLNEGNAITLLSGDLNEDNTINTQDYSIVQKIVGSKTKSSNWNENTDINKDGVINSLDLAFINKNFGKIGDSGAWTSPLPKSATPSGSLTPQGYWLWFPGFEVDNQ